MRDTSAMAYDELHVSGRINNMERQILCAMRADRDYSLNELVSITGLAINCISGRCCDLKRKGFLEEGPTRKCSRSGNTIHPVRIPQMAQVAA